MKNSKLIRRGIVGLVLLTLAFIAPSTFAYPGGRGHHRGPPPEAVTACEGAGENETCTFEAPHGTVEGTCRNIRDQLACAPEGGPRHPPREGSENPEEA